MCIQLIVIGHNQEENFMKTMKTRLCGAFFGGAAILAVLIISACTFSLDPVNAITDAFRFADTNVGTLRVVNDAKNGAILYGIQVIMPDKSLSEYHFENGLLPGNSREYRLPAQITYNIKFGNGKGWSTPPRSVYFIKDETFTVTFTGNEEISIDLSGAKGKLTVYNAIPDTKGEYVIENLRISSAGADERENIVFYFYTANGIHNGEKPDFDVLPGDYWVRAQIRKPDGKLSKWSIPAHVGNYSTTDKDQFEVSAEPKKVTVSADRGGIAVFNEMVLQSGQPGSDVNTGDSNFPSIPDNSLLDNNGNEIPNVVGKVDPDSKPVKSIKVEKLGFPTADRNGVTGFPTYTYAQKDNAVRDGKIVNTRIYDQETAAGGTWHLALAEPGWYLLSFSTDGKTFSKPYPIRLEDKNGNGKIDPGEVEPGVIPPYNDEDSTWTEKQGVVVSNDTPAEGGKIYQKDANGNWVDTGKTLSPADAQKPITDIKVYNPDGSLQGHYRNRYGLPVYNGKEWIITPALPPGDYLVTLSDDNGTTWTDPPDPLRVDGNGDGNIDYDKTHPFWDTTTTGKPGPELTSPTDPKWNGEDSAWDPKTEIDPKTPIYVVVPSYPPLDTVPPGTGPKELDNVKDPNGDGNYNDTPSAPGSQLDILHLNFAHRTSGDKPDLEKINYIKLNSFATPNKAYRIIDLTRITYGTDTDGISTITGGIPEGKRLSLVGFDFKPGLYYVYLSENGHVWWKYKIAVNVPAPWTTDTNGKVMPVSEKDVEKVIYKIVKTNDNNDEEWECGGGLIPPNSGGDEEGGDNGGGGNDGGGLDAPKKGFLVIQNLSSANVNYVTIRRPYANGSYLVDGAITYNERPVTIDPQKFEIFDIPISESSSYQVKVTNTASVVGFYRVSIAERQFTYLAFKGSLPDGSGTEDNPIVVGPGGSGELPGVPGEGGTGGGGGGGTTPPVDDNDDLTVIGGGGGSGGPLQPADGTPAFDATDPNGTFDRSYASIGDRQYPSGLVQPYFPNPSVSVPFPQGGDGTKQNMGGRGYFNFRFQWRADSDWGIGYLAIQKLQRRGTSSAKDPVGPVIVLLDAKANNAEEMGNGEGQRRLGMIYNSAAEGSVKGEDRSFNDWQRNWLGLRDPATGWQVNVKGNALDATQPVYRSGKGYYPGRDTAWEKGKKDEAEQREYGVHRAVNNPGRLYTTGITSSGLYAPLGAGFEAGEYRVYLYKGYDSLYRTTATSGHNDSVRQKKMYRYYDANFDIAIYPGVVTTAVYRDGLKKTEGAFAYTPIPQAAFGRLVVLNNPPNNDYTVTAILLDKSGYQSSVNSSSKYEVHRYLAAEASTPSSMTGGTPNLLNGNSWGTMNPLLKGQMHTFVLPPGGYRIAVQSTRNRDSLRTWYGESSGSWLPIVVTEGETVYLTYRGDELSR
jgi:hypothetical protein